MKYKREGDKGFIQVKYKWSKNIGQPFFLLSCAFGGELAGVVWGKEYHLDCHFSSGLFVCSVHAQRSPIPVNWKRGWRVMPGQTTPVEQCSLALANVPIAMCREVYRCWHLNNKNYKNIERSTVITCDFKSTCLRGKLVTGFFLQLAGVSVWCFLNYYLKVATLCCSFCFFPQFHPGFLRGRPLVRVLRWEKLPKSAFEQVEGLSKQGAAGAVQAE